MDVDQRMLVIGYLPTVASRLDQRGSCGRWTREPTSLMLWGSLILDPAPALDSGRARARVRWEPGQRLVSIVAR
jgi:hypothetical protein